MAEPKAVLLQPELVHRSRQRKRAVHQTVPPLSTMATAATLLGGVSSVTVHGVLVDGWEASEGAGPVAVLDGQPVRGVEIRH